MKLSSSVILASLALAGTLMAGCSPSNSPTDADSPGGAWGFEDQGRPQLTLEPDGSLHGTDGCNRMTGSWEAAGDATGEVTFGPIATTMMACMGVDTWLSGAGSARAEGDTLRVFDQAGGEIGTLPRMEPAGG